MYGQRQAAAMSAKHWCRVCADPVRVPRPLWWPLSSTMPPLAALPTVPACARAFVRQALCTWLLDSVADVAEIVISELATNAVNASTDAAGLPLYSGGRMAMVRVCALTDGVRVLLEVHDQAPGVPAAWHAAADEEHGRGLELVDALSDRWGWRPADGRPGKCVWAQIPVLDPSPLSKRR